MKLLHDLLLVHYERWCDFVANEWKFKCQEKKMKKKHKKKKKKKKEQKQREWKRVAHVVVQTCRIRCVECCRQDIGMATFWDKLIIIKCDSAIKSSENTINKMLKRTRCVCVSHVMSRTWNRRDAFAREMDFFFFFLFILIFCIDDVTMAIIVITLYKFRVKISPRARLSCPLATDRAQTNRLPASNIHFDLNECFFSVSFFCRLLLISWVVCSIAGKQLIVCLDFLIWLLSFVVACFSLNMNFN